MPRQRGEREQHKGLACSHCVKVNVVSNYTTQLTQAYTKPAEALWQQHKIADTEIQLLHNCPSSTLPSFPLDSKQGRLWPRGERRASPYQLSLSCLPYGGRISKHIANTFLSGSAGFSSPTSLPTLFNPHHNIIHVC